MSLKITVKYFGSVKDDAGLEMEIMEVPEGSSVSSIIGMIKEERSGLSLRKNPLMFALNQNFCDGNRVLADNDELALFPVVSGG